MENQNEVEINLLDLFRYVKKKILIVAAAFVICALSGFVVSKFFMTPMYEASTRVYVLNRTSGTGIVSQDFTLSDYVLSDYKVLITGRNVTQEVIDKLNLNIHSTELSKKIKITAQDNTRVLQISVLDENPRAAADIANCVREVASQQIKEIMDVDAVNLVYAAETPQKPISPRVMRNTALSAIVGTFICIGVLCAIYFLDDSIRTEEDVERYLGLGTLGVIPLSNEMMVMSSHPVSKKKRRLGKR